jgi:hypothetical protein
MTPIERVHNLSLLASTVSEDLLLNDPAIIEIQMEIANLAYVLAATRPEERESPEITRVISEIEKKLYLYIYP